MHPGTSFFFERNWTGRPGLAIIECESRPPVPQPIISFSRLEVSGGTLHSFGNSAAIAGDVRVYNAGVLQVGTAGSPGAASFLTQTSGSLLIGAAIPNGASTAGTLNVTTGSTFSMPAAAASSTFVVAGSGTINMYGGTLTMSVARVSALVINGTLNSYGGPPPPTADFIFGNVVNNGTIDFAGSLHALNIWAIGGAGGNYTQGSLGTLAMRLNNNSAEDALAVAGTATLDGFLELEALAALTAGQTWQLIGTGGGIIGDFDTIEFPPDGNPNWLGGGAPIYTVTN